MNIQDPEKAFVSINKEQLCLLPAEEYSGDIVLVDSPVKLTKAIKKLKNAPIIGFDTETRPSFRKGQTYKVSLIQLYAPDCCYLFRTNEIGYPKDLIDILEDEKILKVGLSIHDDFHNLNKVAEIFPKGFIDLQSFVKDFKIADNSLSRLYGILFDKRISKSQRLTNWEAPELSEAQQKYAALDAYACIKIYNYLKEGKFDPFKSQYVCYPREIVEEQPES